jgi:hypothetical protein
MTVLTKETGSEDDIRDEIETRDVVVSRDLIRWKEEVVEIGIGRQDENEKENGLGTERQTGNTSDQA